MNKNQENQKIINKAVDVILHDRLKNSISAILLFGSHAGGTATKRSDIDICVVFGNISMKEATAFRIRVSGELPKKADVQVFNVLPQKIKKSIAKNHKQLYKDETFDNMLFTIKHIKDNDYFLRIKRVFGAAL